MASTLTRAVSVVGVLTGIVVFIAAVGLIALYFRTVSHVMTKTNPDQRHVAKLYRYQAIDLNLSLFVDGRNVYYSPDFAPTKADAREQIAWSSDGQAVIVMVGGRRLFGYQAAENRPLTESELAIVEFTPFEDLGYEGTRNEANAAE